MNVVDGKIDARITIIAITIKIAMQSDLCVPLIAGRAAAEAATGRAALVAATAALKVVTAAIKVATAVVARPALEVGA